MYVEKWEREALTVFFLVSTVEPGTRSQEPVLGLNQETNQLRSCFGGTLWQSATRSTGFAN